MNWNKNLCGRVLLDGVNLDFLRADREHLGRMPVCSRGRPQIPGQATRETVVPRPSDRGTRPPPGTRERPRAHCLGRERARSVGAVTSARATGWPHSCGVSTAHCDQRFTRGILTSPRRTESRYGIRITTEGGTTRSVVATQNSGGEPRSM